MESGSYQGRLRKRPTSERQVTRQNARETTKRKKRRTKRRIHNDLSAGLNAEEMMDRAVPAIGVERQQVANQEENARDDGAIPTMKADNEMVLNREEGKRDAVIPTKVVGVQDVNNPEGSESEKIEMSFMQMGVQDVNNPEENKTTESEMSTMKAEIQDVNNPDENEKQKEDVITLEENQDVKGSGDTVVREMIQEYQVTDQEVRGVIQEEHRQEDEGKLVIYYNENQHGIDFIDEDIQAGDNQEGKDNYNKLSL